MDRKVFKKKKDKLSSMFSRSLLSRDVTIPMSNIGDNLMNTLEQFIAFHFENKCVIEGFVKAGSIKIVTFSSGEVIRGNMIKFNVVFECEICFPVEGMLISCVAQNITKAGIKAASADETPSPIVVFIARDHNYNNTAFSNVKLDEIFTVRVIGQRFELNDKYISIIGEVVPSVTGQKDPPKHKAKPKIVIAN